MKKITRLSIIIFILISLINLTSCGNKAAKEEEDLASALFQVIKRRNDPEYSFQIVEIKTIPDNKILFIKVRDSEGESNEFFYITENFTFNQEYCDSIYKKNISKQVFEDFVSSQVFFENIRDPYNYDFFKGDIIYDYEMVFDFDPFTFERYSFKGMILDSMGLTYDRYKILKESKIYNVGEVNKCLKKIVEEYKKEMGWD